MTFISMCAVIAALSPIQQVNLHTAYDLGKPHDYGYTLAAIALKESSAGKFRINLNSKDLGLFHVNIKTAADTLGVKGHYATQQLAQDLIYNDRLSAQIAVSVLEHFRKGRTLTAPVYKEMLMSYNRGYSWRTSKSKKKEAEAYYNDVVKKVKLIQQCVRDLD